MANGKFSILLFLCGFTGTGNLRVGMFIIDLPGDIPLGFTLVYVFFL